MRNEDIMNILFSFIFIGIIVLMNSVKSTLWGLYWILFSLYLVLFFMLGISKDDGDSVVWKMVPLIIVSLLITWLLQIFRSNYELIIEDNYIRKMQYGITKIPDVFYQLYSATLVFLIVKITVILKIARDGITGGDDSSKPESEKMAKAIMQLSIYGLSIITFMLIMAMQIVTNFYITEG
jgi:hypothetical protein